MFSLRPFVRIRHFGLLANRQRTQLISLCRAHLQADAPALDPPQIRLGIHHITFELEKAIHQFAQQCNQDLKPFG